jgi:hypothetical protein
LNFAKLVALSVALSGSWLSAEISLSPALFEAKTACVGTMPGPTHVSAKEVEKLRKAVEETGRFQIVDRGCELLILLQASEPSAWTTNPDKPGQLTITHECAFGGESCHASPKEGSSVEVGEKKVDITKDYVVLTIYDAKQTRIYRDIEQGSFPVNPVNGIVKTLKKNLAPKKEEAKK